MKFNEKEMIPVEQLGDRTIAAESIPQYNTPLTAKENYYRMFNKDGEHCQWIPAHCDCITFNPTASSDLQRQSHGE